MIGLVKIILVFAIIIVLAWWAFDRIEKTPTGQKIEKAFQDVTGISLIEKKKTQIDPEIAKAAAITACKTQKAEEVDFSQGPCVSNNLMENWVADIAHNPRQSAIDDLPQNQCSAFAEGKAHHFVELDENCEVIKIQ